MSVIGGYQTDVNLQNIHYVGDFPVLHSLGGFGTTTGDSTYFQLKLNPPITGYRKGMILEVEFHQSNNGQAFINVDQAGDVPLKKMVNGQLTDLASDDLNGIHQLIFDGNYFQVISGIAPPAPVIDPAGNVTLSKDLGTYSVPPGIGTDEVDLGPVYILKKRELTTRQGIRITVNGLLQNVTDPTARVRVYFNAAELISNDDLNANVNFMADITLYRVNASIQKGWAALYVDGQPPKVRSLQYSGFNLDGDDHPIRVTGQSGHEHPGSVTRFTFVISKLP